MFLVGRLLGTVGEVTDSKTMSHRQWKSMRSVDACHDMYIHGTIFGKYDPSWKEIHDDVFMSRHAYRLQIVRCLFSKEFIENTSPEYYSSLLQEDKLRNPYARDACKGLEGRTDTERIISYLRNRNMFLDEN